MADRNRKRNTGFSPEEYRAKSDAQGGKCAVCREKPRKALSADHDHATGQLRDLLCNGCNLAIGNAKEDPKRLRALAAYLERWKK